MKMVIKMSDFLKACGKVFSGFLNILNGALKILLIGAKFLIGILIFIITLGGAIAIFRKDKKSC